MALPKEPRQKMINLMYLVLTALLALNVSVEILNAFATVNHSLEKTNGVVDASTDNYLTSLKKKMGEQESREKATLWYSYANQIKQMSDSTFNDIKWLKDSLLRATDFNPAKNKDSSYKDDDIEAAQRIIIEGGQGKKLLDTLKDFKKRILAVNGQISAEIGPSFPLDLTPPKTKNNGNKSWEAAYFTMTPTVAALTILSKFQNDVRTAENRAVEFCLKQVGQVEIRFDQYAPIVSQSATYVMNGQEVDVTAGLGAFNSKNTPIVTIDGQSEATGLDGLVTRKIPATGVGSHSIQVSISYKDEDGIPRHRDTTLNYIVGEPTGISVSADAVKVFYIDLDNPISIASGNVGSEKVNATIDNGSIRRGDKPGQWIVRPAKPGMATVNVEINGKSTPFSFRVKSVPDPIAVVGVNKGGHTRVNDFKAQFGVSALLENFIFEGVKFNVVSYTIVLNGGKIQTLQFRQVQGASFDPVRDLIEKAGPGTSVTLDEIKASGPGGTRTLPPIVFNLY